MKIRLWSLRSQLLIVFSAASFILALLLVSLTIIQLQWIKTTMLALSQEEVTRFHLEHMGFLIGDEQQRITRLLQKHMNQAFLIADLYESIFRTMPIVTEQPHYSHEQITAKVDYGVFFSKHPQISTEGEEVITKAVAMDKVFRSLFDGAEYLNVYSGFYTDDLFYLYPAEYFVDASFTPYQREWFYKANQTAATTQITEPYLTLGSANRYVVSFSRTFSHEGSVIGVASLDVDFQSIKDMYSGFNLGGSGYELLVSKNGIIFGHPKDWVFKGEVVRIDDEAETGISHELWEEILQGVEDGEDIGFTDVSKQRYRLVKRGVYPYKDDPTLMTHVLLLCVKEEAFVEKYKELEQEFTDIYRLIFWSVISIAASFFVAIIGVILWHTQKIIKSMRIVHDFVRQINLNAQKHDMTQNVSTGPLRGIRSTLAGLQSACKEKKQAMSELEREFADFNWGEVRPMDATLFDEWRKVVYPANRFKKDVIEWNGVLERLKEVQKQRQQLVGTELVYEVLKRGLFEVSEGMA